MFSFIHFFEVAFFHMNVLHVLMVVWRTILQGTREGICKIIQVEEIHN